MNATTAPTLTVRREIAAPAQELFDAWLDPKSLAIWMRPGSTVRSTAKTDPRVGGTFDGEGTAMMHRACRTHLTRALRLLEPTIVICEGMSGELSPAGSVKAVVTTLDPGRPGSRRAAQRVAVRRC